MQSIRKPISQHIYHISVYLDDTHQAPRVGKRQELAKETHWSTLVFSSAVFPKRLALSDWLATVCCKMDETKMHAMITRN